MKTHKLFGVRIANPLYRRQENGEGTCAYDLGGEKCSNCREGEGQAENIPWLEENLGTGHFRGGYTGSLYQKEENVGSLINRILIDLTNLFRAK
jgi:hypothetical protein